MLKHRGELFQNIVRKWCKDHGFTLAYLAKKAGYSRNMVYHHFNDENLDYSIIFKYGKAMKHDFSSNFPEMSTKIFKIETETNSSKETINTEDCLAQIEHWKNKYIALLEHYNSVVVDKLLLNK